MGLHQRNILGFSQPFHQISLAKCEYCEKYELYHFGINISYWTEDIKQLPVAVQEYIKANKLMSEGFNIMFKIIKDYEQYKQFIQSTFDDFGCPEEWEDFFDFKLKWNEETGELLETIEEYQGIIRNCPESFPCVLWYTNDTEIGMARVGGDLTVRQLDWIGVDSIISEIE